MMKRNTRSQKMVMMAQMNASSRQNKVVPKKKPVNKRKKIRLDDDGENSDPDYTLPDEENHVDTSGDDSESSSPPSQKGKPRDTRINLRRKIPTARRQLKFLSSNQDENNVEIMQPRTAISSQSKCEKLFR